MKHIRTASLFAVTAFFLTVIAIPDVEALDGVAPNNARSMPETFDGAVINGEGRPIFGPQSERVTGSDYYDLGDPSANGEYVCPDCGQSTAKSTTGNDSTGWNLFPDAYADDGDGYLGPDALDNTRAASGILSEARSGATDNYHGGGTGKGETGQGSDGRNDGFWGAVEAFFSGLKDALGFSSPTGDPAMFALEGEACTKKKHLGGHKSTYYRMNLYSTDNPIMLPVDRELCDNTFMVVFDWDENELITDGIEILYSQTLNAFEIMDEIDRLVGNGDGYIKNDEPVWSIMYLAQQNGNSMELTRPGEHGVIGFIVAGERKFFNDAHGVGVYADEAGVSGKHWRINSVHYNGVMLEDGTTRPLYGAVIGALQDCTVHDIRYHVAEKHTGEYLRADELGIEQYDPRHLYEEALEYCDVFAEAHQNPDKYLSHWVAGIASMEHKLGFEDNTRYVIAEELYEEALQMSPDNPFYNTDYCLLQYHMGDSTSECIGAMNKAIEDRPDVEWFVEARDIALRGSQH